MMIIQKDLVAENLVNIRYFRSRFSKHSRYSAINRHVFTMNAFHYKVIKSSKLLYTYPFFGRLETSDSAAADLAELTGTTLFDTRGVWDAGGFTTGMEALLLRLGLDSTYS